MNRKWSVIIVVAAFLTAVDSLPAQRPTGGGRPSSSGQGQMSGQQHQGSEHQQGSAQQQSMHSQQQMRVQSLATDQQRSAMEQTITATQQLRFELKSMRRLQKSQPISVDQARRWREQIREQLRAIQQEQQTLIAGLTGEQQSWVTDDLQQMAEATTNLNDLLDALSIELEQTEIDEQAIKQKAKQADDKAKKVESEEKQIMAELDLDI